MMIMIRRKLSITFAIILGFIYMIGPAASYVHAETTISYIERSWDGSKVVSETKSASPTPISSCGSSLASGWYYVDSDPNYGSSTRLNISGDVKLILCDGTTLTCNDGINVASGSSLTIYGQSGDSGQLIAKGDTNNCAAIGGKNGESCGTVIIHGGKVSADGYNGNEGEDGAGIGGGDSGDGGDITIYGGTVAATGSNNGAGIGGGTRGAGGNITIYGGNVTAQGGVDSAGIGGGDVGSSGTVNIYGGTVTATGGENGAGIGSGDAATSNGTITLNGGNVTATGGNEAAGIGGGDQQDGGTISIDDAANVTATGGTYSAGIGGGYKGAAGTININGGKVNAKGGVGGAGIGTGSEASGASNITISGGEVTAVGGPHDVAGPNGNYFSMQQPGAAIGGAGKKSDDYAYFNGSIELIGGTIDATTGGGWSCGDNGSDLKFPDTSKAMYIFAIGSMDGGGNIIIGSDCTIYARMNSLVQPLYFYPMHANSIEFSDSQSGNKSSVSKLTTDSGYEEAATATVGERMSWLKDSRVLNVPEIKRSHDSVVIHPCKHQNLEYIDKGDKEHHTKICKNCGETTTESHTIHNYEDSNNSECTECSYHYYEDGEKVKASATGYNGPYTGQWEDSAHGITVNVIQPLAGKDITIKYGESADDCNSDSSPTIKDVGTKTVYYEVSSPGLETFKGSADIVINKVPLTVQANDKTITYGEEAPDYDVSYSGFVHEPSSYYYEENKNYLGGQLSYDCAYTKDADAGKYRITPKGLTSGNYDISFVSGWLTVKEAAPDVTAPTAKEDLVANGSSQELITAGSATNGTMYYAVTTTNAAPANESYITSIPTETDAGTYYVWYKVVGDKNYSDTEPKSLTVEVKEPEAPTPIIPPSALGVKDIENPLGIGQWNYVYFGNKVSDKYVRYRVLDKAATEYGNDTTILLDCDYVLEKRQFDDNSNVWAESEVNSYLNGDFLTDNFEPIERSAIVTSSKKNASTKDGAGYYYYYSNIEKTHELLWAPLSNSEKIFLLDAKEASGVEYGYIDDINVTSDSRRKCMIGTQSYANWWLRSAFNQDSRVAGYMNVQTQDDYTYDSIYFASVTTETIGISPAFNVDLSSIIFSTNVSSVASGQSGAEYKLTLIDSDMTASVNGTVTIDTENNVSIPYEIATGSSNAEDDIYVSAIVTDGTWTSENSWSEGAKLLQYARCANVSSQKSGIATFALDESISGTWGQDYHVYILAENVHTGDEIKHTDYASAPVKLGEVTAIKADPIVTAPKAQNNMIYTGSEQELVTAGSVSGGTMKYAITTENTAPTDDSQYTTAIPAKANAGTYYIWYKVIGDDKHNNMQATSITVSINKVAVAGGYSVAKKTGVGLSETVDISNMLKDGASLNDLTLGTYDESIFNNTPTVANDIVSYKIKSDATAGIINTITIPVTGGMNYQDYSIVITVTVTDKDTPTVTVSDIETTYTGNPVAASSIKGSATFDGKTVSGTWTFKDTQGLTNVSDSGVKQVIFTPTDTNTYATVETTLTLTIKKAKVTGSPSYTTISASGKTLQDAEIGVGTLSPEGGVIAWDLTDATEIERGTSYAWTYTPIDTNNYNTKTGSVILWPNASSGAETGGTSGGSSGTGGTSGGSSETDYSTENTVINDDGTTTVRTENSVTNTTADGTKEVIKTEAETIKNEDGSIVSQSMKETTTSYDESGKITGIRYKITITQSETIGTAYIVEDASGEIVSAEAEATATATASGSDMSAVINTQVISALKEAVEKDFQITITVKTGIEANSLGAYKLMKASPARDAFTVTVNTADIDKELKIYDITDAKASSEYAIVNNKKYTADEDGNLELVLESGRDYLLEDEQDAKSIDDSIKATVSAKDKTVSLKAGNTYTFSLAEGANTASIKSISYVSSDNSVAKVSKSGTIKGVAKGKANIAATVVFKDSSTMELSTKITVTKKANTLTVKTKTYTIKVKALNNKSVKNATISASKVEKSVTGAKGVVTYKKYKGNSKISISRKGKITLSKGIKTDKVYTIKVLVKAAGTNAYKPSTKMMTIKLKVIA